MYHFDGGLSRIDCVYEKHVTEIRLYSSFKCASDYRYVGLHKIFIS